MLVTISLPEHVVDSRAILRTDIGFHEGTNIGLTKVLM